MGEAQQPHDQLHLEATSRKFQQLGQFLTQQLLQTCNVFVCAKGCQKTVVSGRGCNEQGRETHTHNQEDIAACSTYCACAYRGGCPTERHWATKDKPACGRPTTPAPFFQPIAAPTCSPRACTKPLADMTASSPSGRLLPLLVVLAPPMLCPLLASIAASAGDDTLSPDTPPAAREPCAAVDLSSLVGLLQPLSGLLLGLALAVPDLRPEDRGPPWPPPVSVRTLHEVEVSQAAYVCRRHDSRLSVCAAG